MDYENYLEAKNNWENIIKIKNDGILIRSKAQWCEEGEKSTKFFLNLEKRNYNTKCIKTLITNNNTQITDMTEIIAEQKKFYETLYTSKADRSIELPEYNFFTEDNTIPILTNTDKQMCESEITTEECEKALKLLENGKSPGSDGFTTDFYKFFWSDLKDTLFNSYLESFETKSLSQFQKLGILNLLPKKDKDLRYLANWRPVSLLNTDYKILTKLLAIRLQKVITNIIDPDQVGYIKDRYIGENIRIMYDLLLYADIEELEAYVTQIDFEKAFDSIEWDFLIKALKVFNFGDNFISWIKILYTDISACVGNNGHFSGYFKLSRSIRQGCPISALLFLIVVELLAHKIRITEEIKGIQIQDQEHKIKTMADDATLFSIDIASIEKAIEIFNKFHRVSGLKLNLTKTEIIPIGTMANKVPIIPNTLREIKVKHGAFKGLGVWFTLNKNEQVHKNCDERIKNMRTLLNIWKQRNLSLKGKILIIRTLILPQIQFLFNMIEIPINIIRKIDEMLFEYLWNGKTHKIKQNTVIGPIEHGGLNMIDVYAIQKAANIGWIKRLFDNNRSKWKTLFIYMANIDKDKLKYNPGTKYNCKTGFHQQIMDSWQELNNTKPINTIDILNRYILHNQHIQINKNSVISKFFTNEANNEVLNIKIIDIIDNNVFKSLENIKLQYDTNLSTLNYNSIKSAIPKHWKKQIFSENDLTQFKSINMSVPHIKIGNIHKPITKTSTKEYYLMLVNNKITPPSAIEKWLDIFPFLENFDWKDIYKIPYLYTQEPYLQSFQYKIINRILNTKEKLYHWKITPDNKCKLCGQVDTLEHHLYYCRSSEQIWASLQEWLNNHFETSFKLTVCEVLFGIPFIANEYSQLLNFLIIVTKWYINNCKTYDHELRFMTVKSIYKNKIRLIILNNTLKDKPVKEWQRTLHNIF